MSTEFPTNDPFALGRLISGGQTGVDQASLESARFLGIPIGGWCPAGRRCESGVIPNTFPLQETPSPQYPVRTRWNVRDSDATLVITDGALSRGTDLTLRMAEKCRKPFLVLQLPGEPTEPAQSNLLAWLYWHRPRILNVAGPRASESVDLPARVFRLLTGTLAPGPPEQTPPWPPRRPRTNLLALE